MTSTKVYIPRDSAALAVGADEVAALFTAEAKSRGLDIQIIRNSSRGMFWLETLVEVETAKGRVAYGPVEPSDVAGLLDAGCLTGAKHALGHGLTDEIPYLAKQERLTFSRMGITDPVSLTDYEAHGGWVGLKNALKLDGAGIVNEVLDSGLRGRGGAAFPAGIKWRTVMQAQSAQKYVV